MNEKLSPKETQEISEAAKYAVSDSTGGQFWADVGAQLTPVQAPAVDVAPRPTTETD